MGGLLIVLQSHLYPIQSHGILSVAFSIILKRRRACASAIMIWIAWGCLRLVFSRILLVCGWVRFTTSYTTTTYLYLSWKYGTLPLGCRGGSVNENSDFLIYSFDLWRSACMSVSASLWLYNTRRRFNGAETPGCYILLVYTIAIVQVNSYLPCRALDPAWFFFVETTPSLHNEQVDVDNQLMQATNQQLCQF